MSLRIPRQATFALFLSFLPFAAHAQTDRPCLVGVCGVYSSGFAGVLARHGIPYEIVLDHQLAEAALLAKYDAIVTATMSPLTYADAAQPLEEYVRNGGSFLFDAPYAAKYFVRSLGTRDTFLAEFLTYSRAVAAQSASVRPVALDLFDGALDARDYWSATRITCDVRVDDPNAVVLAEYASTPKMRKTGRTSNPRGRPLKRGDPAVVMVPRGKGKYIVCGSSLGAAQALGGGRIEKIVLAMIRLLTEGRATPQLDPEGIVLARRQSKRSLDMETPEENAFLTTPPDTEQGVEGPGEPSALPAGAELLEQKVGPGFDVSGTYSGSGSALLWLNYWNDKHNLRVDFRRGRAEIIRTAGGRASRVGRLSFPPDEQSFVVKERADAIRLHVGRERLLVQAKALWIGDVGHKGAAIGNVRYQPVEPVYFADDFMRAEGEMGEWDVLHGTWKRSPVQNPDMGANPFAFHVTTNSPGLAVAGYRFWDTYRFRCSARPDSETGQLGLMAYRQDDDDYLLFRCRITDAPMAHESGFEIVRVLDGREEVLEAARGGLVAGQSYLLEIKLLDKWIGAFVDGEKVLTAVDTSLPGGALGLWADSTEVKFDDVVVEPSNLRQARGTVFDSSLPNYAGVIDQDTWAGPAMQWQPSPSERGLFWNRGVFHGDVGVRLDMRALHETGSSAELIVNAAPEARNAGYAFRASRTGEALAVQLSRAGQVVKSGTVPVVEGEPPVVAFRRAGDTIYGRVDGEVVVKYVDPSPLTSRHQIGFAFTGGKPRISDVVYWSDNMLEYAFDTAPTDWWIGSGTWDVTNRWSCTPDWSWFGGTSPSPSKGVYQGRAVIWCKRRFEGDVALDYFAGPRMLDAARGAGARERMGDFNAVLCADGNEVDTGYAFVVAPNNTSELLLLRRGEVVARNTDFLMPRQGHNRWTAIRAQRAGDAIRLFFEGQLVLEYEDEDPLPGGYAGVWTEDNGILVPKVTIYHEERGGPLLSLVE